MRGFDLSSWQSVLLSVIGVALFALISIGIRLLMMFTIQQRRERVNRQINERLRTLIAAYKTLGGSFTGELTVDPTHLRELQQRAKEQGDVAHEPSERPRRIRDTVGAALSDIILLGTEEHVRLAGQAATDMAASRPIQTAELVTSLRNFIRQALDLAPIPADVQIPRQGPTRQPSGGGKGKGDDKGKGGMGGGRGGGGMGLGAGGGSSRGADDV